MRILTIHNKYKIRGGEDEARESEGELLMRRGHEVSELIFDNQSIGSRNATLVGLQATFNRSSYCKARAQIAAFRPDVVDIHNFFPLASPSVHYAAWDAGVPVVQKLHNYRLLCPGGVFFRENAPCEDCMGRAIPWPGVVHACYRGGHLATAAVASMISVHNLLSTWKKRVSRFVALTDFARDKFIAGGLPANRIVVKPNFVPIDLGPGPGDEDLILYVGRLSVEKGIHLLLETWREAAPQGRLVVVGDGPLAPIVERAAAADQSIEYVGRRPLRETLELMGRARALVFPSIWYEGMPRVVIEAFCRGTPVIAFRLGSMMEMIRDGQTGWLAKPGDRQSFAQVLARVFSGTDGLAMRAAARAEFESKYTPDRNYDMILRIYEEAVAARA